MARQKQSNKSQHEKFIETARAHGCDESLEAFDAQLKRLVTVKPMTQQELKKKAKKKR